MSVEVGDAATDHPLALRPGSILDARYRLLRLLAGTSCAASYLAQDDRSNELVLIEEFLPRSLVTRDASGAVRPHTAADEVEYSRAAKRFAREGERLAEIDHPNLVRVHRSFEANGTAYVVMSHREAVPLAGFVAGAGGRLAAAPATELVRRVLDALEAMHAEGVFHRNLSPASVQVDAAGRPLLHSVAASRHLPQARDLVDGFAPIELYGSRGVGPWTDVYSASALLYYLLSGAVPASAIERAAGQMLASPGALVSGISPALATAVMRGLAQLPEQRPHSAAELARLLSGSNAPSASIPAVAAPAPMPSVAAPSELASPEPNVAFANTVTPPPASGAVPPIDSTALRFTAGVVMPEHDNLAGRMKKWLSGYRVRGGDTEFEPTDEERAILDAASRFASDMHAPAAAAPAKIAAPPVVHAAPAAVTSAPLARAPEPAPVQAPAPLPTAPIARAPEPAALEALAPVSTAPIARAPEPVEAPEPSPAPVAPPVLEEEAAPEPEPVVIIAREERKAPLPPVAEEEEAEEQSVSLGLLVPPFESAVPAVAARPELAGSEESDADLFRHPLRLRMPAWARKRATKTAWTTAAVLLLGAALGGAAYAARSSSDPDQKTSVTQRPSTPSTQAGPAAPVATDSARGRIRGEASGAVLQGAPGTADSTRVAPRTERPRPAERESQPANDAKPPVVSGLAAVSVSVATPNEAPLLLPAEVVLDIRDRLAQGRLLAEGGDYAGARRALKTALSAIDTAAAHYVSSDALRNLRRDVEKEAQSALDACSSENEIRKRRDGKTLSCG